MKPHERIRAVAGEIRSINMYPGLSNRQTSGGIIKYGNIKW